MSWPVSVARPILITTFELQANNGGESKTLLSAGTNKNQMIADTLRKAGDLLQAQDASPFRVAAYRRAVLQHCARAN